MTMAIHIASFEMGYDEGVATERERCVAENSTLRTLYEQEQARSEEALLIGVDRLAEIERLQREKDALYDMLLKILEGRAAIRKDE